MIATKGVYIMRLGSFLGGAVCAAVSITVAQSVKHGGPVTLEHTAGLALQHTGNFATCQTIMKGIAPQACAHAVHNMIAAEFPSLTKKTGFNSFTRELLYPCQNPEQAYNVLTGQGPANRTMAIEQACGKGGFR
jgi:hypothetical protein